MVLISIPTSSVGGTALPHIASSVSAPLHEAIGCLCSSSSAVLVEFTAGQMLCLLESHSDRDACLLARFFSPPECFLSFHFDFLASFSFSALLG